MKKIVLCIGAVLWAVGLVAGPSIKVQVPEIVGPDEQFQITFSIEVDDASVDFDWNCPDSFQVIWGPQKGFSSSSVIVNGKRTSSSQVTYSYILKPTDSGTFQLPPAVVTVDGASYQSRPVTVKVVSGSPERNAPAAGEEASGQPQAAAPASERLFMRLYLNKGSVVVGEPVTATLKLYHRVDIAGFEDARFPDFKGFWCQEMPMPSNLEFRREDVGGEIFNAAVLRSWKLIPQQAGKVAIDPAELVCLVNVRRQRTVTGSIFDDFFQDDYTTVRKRIYTSAVTLDVRNLPAGAPSSFGGGVGRFTMSASLTRNAMKENESASLIVTVSGRGNLALIEAPKVRFPAGFEVYDTKVTESGDSRIFEYPFIPRSYGEFEIPAVEYSYYDVDSGKYVTLNSDAFAVTAQKDDAAVGSAGSLVALPDRKDVKTLGSDIRFIDRSAPSLSEKGAFFVGSPLFWIVLVFLSVAAAAFQITSSKLERRRADIVSARRRRANKLALKRLAAARANMENDVPQAFYEELHRALLGYVSDRLDMDMSQMSRENISEKLILCSVPEATARVFTDLLEACEFARYAPSSDHEAMTAHYGSAATVISEIETYMKRKGKGAVAPVLLMLLLPSAFMMAAEVNADSLWTAGVEAYEAGDWQRASDCWATISDGGLESAQLYYNSGNASFKAGDYARAILNYERALRIDPSYSDARYNLELADARIKDRVEAVPEFFLTSMLHRLNYRLSSDAWAILFLSFAALFLLGLLLFLRSGERALRKTGFFTGVVSIAVSVLCICFSVSQKRSYERRDSAVVVAPVCAVKSAPGETSTDLFLLHEGIRVKMLESAGGWMNIELADGRQGWMKVGDADVI